MRQIKERRESRYARVEPLEGRQLLSGEPWGAQAKLIGQDVAASRYPSITGAGQSIAVIDSGVDYNHPALGGGFGGGRKVAAGWDFQSNDGNPMGDTNGHGTGAAGIAAASPYVYKGYRYQGIAPGANVIALRQNNTYGVKSALEWVLNNRTKYNIVAVNLTDFGGASAVIYKNALTSLINAGVFVSHPSGNGGAGAQVGASFDPADVSVGSVNRSGQISSFTQRGPELDLLAPGEKVTLPYYDVGSKRHIYVDTADGTSWSSPAAAGAAALIKQIDPRFSPLQILRILQDSGAPVYDGATKRTYKRLDLGAALALAYQRKGSAPQAPAPSGPIAVPPPTAQSPFSGSPIRIAGDTTLQAENFDNGGQGVAFHDTETANYGGNNYRPGHGVDIESTSGGGRHLAFAKPGEWLEYTVNVASAGTFNFTARVASQGNGGRFHVEVDGADKTGQITVPNTGKWQNWTTVSRSGVSLPAGTHVIRVKMDSAGSLGYVGNLDWFRFTPAGGTSAPSAPSTGGGTRSALQAFTATAYSAQSGTTNGPFLGSLDQGDWVAYKGLDFGNNGARTFSAGVAAANGWGGKKIQIRVGSGTGRVIGTLTVPATGSWTNFRTVSTSLEKVTGVQDVYFTFVGGAVGNMNWFKFS